MIVGIVVALPEELGTLTAKKIAKGQCDFIADDIVVACSGAGRDNAVKAASLLLEKGADTLISWGCAGALSAVLNPGDLLLPETLLTDTGEMLLCDESLLSCIKKNLPLECHSGILAESLAIIGQADDKKKLHLNTQAVAVDMESAAVIETAQKAGRAAIVIRAIADPATMSLPQAVTHALNDEGEVVLTRLLSFLLTHPGQIPALIRLGMHFSAAKNKLKAVATHLDTIVGFDSHTSA